MTSPLLNAISFDIEEYFQVSNYAHVFPREQWDAIPARVQRGVDVILETLARCDVRATFFFLGWIAERHPEMVRTVGSQGHEIAIHGYDHQLVYDMGPERFREDLRRTRALLETALRSDASPSIIGYRAPSFSITERSLWAFPILAEEGFRYDSSIFPVRHTRYGIPAAPRVIHRREEAEIVEFPMTSVRLLGRNLPVAGGGYFRLLPYRVTLEAIDAVNREGHPAMIYLHPWEFDPDQPTIRNAGWLNRFRHRVNLTRTEVRLRRLLEARRFGTIVDVLRDRGFLTGATSTRNR